MSSIVSATVLCALVLNEVLYDPPGADAGGEFVEIVNPGPEPTSLAGVRLEAADGARPGTWKSVWQGSSHLLAPGALYVVGGESIETRAALLERNLQNGPDALRLRRGDEVLDLLGYGALSTPDLYEGQPAADVSGQSLARKPDAWDTNHNATDFIAADPTPGRNNVARRNWSVRILAADPFRLWPGRRLRLAARIHNTGLELLEDGAWELRAQLRPVTGEPYRDEVQLGPGRSVAVLGSSGGLAAGDSVFVDLTWTAELGLHRLEFEAHGSDEEHLDNHDEIDVRVGAGPVLVNEVLFAPQPDAPEWVELWNRDRRAHDLNDWTLTDASGTTARFTSAESLQSGGYAIVSADVTTPIPGLAVDAPRIGARPWPSLNNTDGDAGYAETLVLCDRGGVVQDALFYSSATGAGRGRSIERLTADADARGLLWAASKHPSGSTPARQNSALAPPRAETFVELRPNPFSPDGDGVDDLLTVALELPAGATGFRASIFDTSGQRRVELAADRLGAGPRRLVWDGCDASQSALPTGVYILHFEWFGRSGRERLMRTIGLVGR